MGVIYILIPVAIILSAIGIYLFFWAVKTEQFDDLEKQGMSILFDDIENIESKATKDALPTKLADDEALSPVKNENSNQQLEQSNSAAPNSLK
ncbi:MAG: cbb3-type cytochrome oxidase assembly protein CcoS [Colwellia sp.]